MTTTGDPPTPDPPPGRFAERTRLAWRRTVLAVTIVALLALRQALLVPAPALRALAIVALVAGWLTILAVSSRRIVALRARRPAAVGSPVPTLTLFTVALAILGGLLVMA
ncbi:hypothetical protein JQS43_19105 [Natronosporangium hydrolyticum]|uniref:DUF202 domain-containing protein n=1 Tax=Natronosporangium hydrolyticum TaxID=2811111 RepID=A0A895YBL4_9ACTN|nr:DUF202 domain-containing protein [Natronosporangium hydrolyticum]QSB13665.1 hypothetical protein JQS43_19105 [Natronosporangium hydrolyticum]